MAAGAGAASGGSLENTLDKKFRGLSNTMDSIQGLSTWCIDNKKYHSLIVRQWMKCLRKSDPSHRLNLLYLANDIIQNCKRKNAIFYRTAFADVLPDAILLVNHESDPKVVKSVERILSIWEERDVYSGVLITELRGILVKEDSPPVEQKTPVESNAYLRSKIVAEFVPQALVDQLAKYKKSLEEVDLREKQLAAMRVDIFSSDALKKLKDKAGGKKFSKDFEEGSAQLQEFVKFYEKESKVGPPVMEALSNADIFYEMQYKEVKIVANAYQTFANRVSHLKRKLDNLKATLPDLDESPIPSPSADAPSPTGSESPFHGLELAHPDPDLDGSAMDDEAEPPAPSPLSSPGGSPKHTEILGNNDNREVEDMELSDEEMDSVGIIVQEQIEPVPIPKLSTPNPATSEPSEVAKPSQVTPAVIPAAIRAALHEAAPAVIRAAAPAAAPAAIPAVIPAGIRAAAPAAAPAVIPAGIRAAIPSVIPAAIRAAAPAAAPAAIRAAAPLAAAERVDMGKIGSFFNSFNPAMKNPAPVVEIPPASAPVSSSVNTTPAALLASQDPSSLVNLLSKVDVSPADILSALSKVQGQSRIEGIGSLLNSPSSNVPDSTSTEKISPPAPSTPATAGPSQSSTPSFVAAVPSSSSSVVEQRAKPQAPIQTSNKASALVQALHRDMDLTTDAEPSYSSTSLESKIHSFLQGNPAFSAFDVGFTTNPPAGGENFSPATGTDTQGGTPVRDEGGGTPTQDEIMDKPVVVPFTAGRNQPSAGQTAKTLSMAFENNAQQNPGNPQQQTHSQQPGKAQNGQAYQPYPYGKQDPPGHGIPPPHYQQISAQTKVGLPGERAPGSAGGIQTPEGFQGANERNWYGGSYPEGNPQQSGGFNATVPGGIRENKILEPYPYQAEPPQEPKEFLFQQESTPTSSFFKNTFPPVPKLPPPPPPAFDLPPPSVFLPEQRPVPRTVPGGPPGPPGPRGDGVIPGMVVHDHQHKSLLRPEEPHYNNDPHLPPRRPEAAPPPPHRDNFHNQENFDGYHNEPYQNDSNLFHDDPHHPPEDSFYRPGSPPHPYPRPRGRLTPPISPSREPYFPHGYQGHAPSPRQYPPRRPPPHEIRHPGPGPGPRLLHRPPHQPPHPHPRGPPRMPFSPFQGPDMRLRGKRPGPRGGGPMFPLKRPFLPPRY